ncbi:MAG: hypothetical protein ACI4BG_06530 [Prevotella sp.]
MDSKFYIRGKVNWGIDGHAFCIQELIQKWVQQTEHPTYQFNNYSRYNAAMFDETHKAEVRATQFPKDLEAAYELGKRLVKTA